MPITPGLHGEKIRRFSGLRTPGQFVPILDEAQARYSLYKAGEELEPQATRSDSICKAEETELFKTPSEEGPRGPYLPDQH